MSGITRTIAKTCIGLVLATAIGFMTAGVALAEDAGYSVKPIKPAPGFDSSEIDIQKAVDAHFDVVGPLDYIGDKWIVVGDHQINIAPHVRISGVQTGAYVGVRVNDKGEVVEVDRLSRPRPR